MNYVLSYIEKKDVDAGKYDPDKVVSARLRASNVTRAITALKNQLVDSGKIESPGDINILEARLGF